MTSKEQFTLMVSVFQQAASDIEQGRGQRARKCVTELPEDIYDTALLYRKRNKFGYLIRYVLYFIERQSVYCLYNDYIPRRHVNDPKFKKGAQQLEVYRIAYLGLEQPPTVSVARKIVFVNPDILSTPYHPIRKKGGQCKPTPLFS
jgi:hypothetical protein